MNAKGREFDLGNCGYKTQIPHKGQKAKKLCRLRSGRRRNVSHAFHGGAREVGLGVCLAPCSPLLPSIFWLSRSSSYHDP
ncbi:hypothetical protein SUGI_0930420 [Cryptomeria japonica]|nr:hypothetical protein SUGI_0930420 [Cryptomeria japonica]